MTDFRFGVKIPLADDSTTSAALGVDAAGKLTDADVGKAVKLIGDSRYGLCSAADDIEGVLLSVEPVTVNSGFGFGTVQTKERFVGINANAVASGSAMAIGDQVEAAAQGAVGTALPTISTGVNSGVRATPVQDGTGTNFKWRVVSLLGGDGAIGSHVLIERI